MASVLSHASGRSANRARISARRLEPMLGRDAPAVASDEQAAFGDAEQRVMRLVHSGVGEIDVVGRDERQLARIGQRDQSRLERRSLARPWRCSSIVERDRETPPQLREQRVRPPAWPSASSRPSGPVAPPVSSDQPLGVPASAASGSCGLRRDRSPGSRATTGAADCDSPSASCASSTIGSGGRRRDCRLAARARAGSR